MTPLRATPPHTNLLMLDTRSAVTKACIQNGALSTTFDSASFTASHGEESVRPHESAAETMRPTIGSPCRLSACSL